MREPRARCPVCKQRINPTINRKIYGHMDTAKLSACPGSFLDYDLALHTPRP